MKAKEIIVEEQVSENPLTHPITGFTLTEDDANKIASVTDINFGPAESLDQIKAELGMN